MSKKRYRCEDQSPTYRNIINSKHNGKPLNNGTRVGDDLFVDKNGIMSKLSL